jgi:arylsulfatase A-like enzyme
MKRMLFQALLCMSVVFGALAAPQAEHVVLISLDGFRPDAIDKAGATHIQRLIRDGVYCPKAQTVRPSLTTPGHASMLSGLGVARHKATWNDYTPDVIGVPTVFSIARKSGRSTAAIVAKPKLYPLLREQDLDYRYLPPIPENWDSSNPAAIRAGVKKSYAGPPDTTAAGIVRAFSAEWPKLRPAVTFVHFRETDVAGHKYKWMSDEYLEAVRVCDHAVGAVLRAIDDAGLRSKTVVILTSDHGGDGRHHLDDVDGNNTIPWICSGPGVPKGLKIQRKVSVTDTTPTILRLLDIPVPEGLDGRVVEEIFGK